MDKKMRKQMAKRLREMYDELQEMCEKIGPTDEDAADIIAIAQGELENAADALEDF